MKRLGAAVMDEAGFYRLGVRNSLVTDLQQCPDQPQSETDMQLGMLWSEGLLGLVHSARRLLRR